MSGPLLREMAEALQALLDLAFCERDYDYLPGGGRQTCAHCVARKALERYQAEAER